MNFQIGIGDYMQKRSQQGHTVGKKANATLGCIAYVTHDIILPPNTAPLSLRGTTATHSEHRSSRQTETAGQKPQENNYQTQTTIPARKG